MSAAVANETRMSVELSSYMDAAIDGGKAYERRDAGRPNLNQPPPEGVRSHSLHGFEYKPSTFLVTFTHFVISEAANG